MCRWRHPRQEVSIEGEHWSGEDKRLKHQRQAMSVIEEGRQRRTLKEETSTSSKHWRRASEDVKGDSRLTKDRPKLNCD